MLYIYIYIYIYSIILHVEEVFMINKDSIIKKLGFDGLISTSLIDNFYIITEKKGDRKELYGSNEGMAWYVLKGKVKITCYFKEDDKEFFWELEEGEWFGIEDVILENHAEYDVEAYTDVSVVLVPLRKILNNYSSGKILKKIMRDMAASARIREIKAATRIGYGNEKFFLKYLEKNDFILKYNNTKELSEILNMNQRTLQRTLKKLTEKEIITRETKIIKVPDIQVYEEYMKTLTD